MTFPAAPDAPAHNRASARVPLRFEDVTQDGRLQLEALSPALGEVIWRKLLATHPWTEAMRGRGIVPILSRLVIEGGPGTLAVGAPLAASGLYDVGFARGGDGAVERIVLGMWVEAQAPRAQKGAGALDHAGEMAVVGRVYGEHVFTRPFAPPDQRKVTRLDIPGLPELPGTEVPLVKAESLFALPEGATALDEAPRADDAYVVFGAMHTDSNQHVNSLVYPRMVEEAALRRFAAHGRTGTWLARSADIAFRKPFFAGQRARTTLQAFALGERLGVIACVSPDGGDASTRPHTFARLLFER